jgi:chitin disaccharide deacetylase
VSPARRLVVNADDFGRSPAINAGVVQAHVHGIVTSASLMVRHAAAMDAAAAARDHPALGLGLHLDLAEWERVDGQWRATYSVVDTGNRSAVALEVELQLERFRSLVGAEPTHLDSHQHVHRDEPVRSVAMEAAASVGIPLREHGAVRYCGAFYGQDRDGRSMPSAVGAESLTTLLRALPEGYTELCCHPAVRAEPFTSYAVERPLELRALCDPGVRAAVEEGGIRLCSFRDFLSSDGRFAEARRRRA